MSWRDRQNYFPENLSEYKRARFKDTPFWVRSSSYDSGRRQSIQKFPGDRYTNVQDLGQDSANITVDAFLIGDNYDVELLNLKDKLLEGGAGTLELPWLAPLTVTVVGRIRVSEDKQQRGLAAISFDCLESPPPGPTFTRDSAARMRAILQETSSESQQRFARRYSQVGLVEDRRTRVRAALKTAATKITEVQGRVSAFIAEIPEDANSFSQLFGRLNDLVNTPLDLSDEIVNAVVTAYSSLRSVGSTAENVITTWGKGGPLRILADQVFRFNSGFTAEQVDTNSPAGAQEQSNLDEISRFARLAMFFELVDIMPDLPFESYQQAIALRRAFFDEIEPLLATAESAEAESIIKLNAAVGVFLGEVAETLPNLGTYTPPTTANALVIAQQVYGDARRADDLVVRNSIKHPGFVVGGEPLEVIDV